MNGEFDSGHSKFSCSEQRVGWSRARPCPPLPPLLSVGSYRLLPARARARVGWGGRGSEAVFPLFLAISLSPVQVQEEEEGGNEQRTTQLGFALNSVGRDGVG